MTEASRSRHRLTIGSRDQVGTLVVGAKPSVLCQRAPTSRMAGLYLWTHHGIIFGLILPRLTAPFWLCGLGLGLGVIAALVGILVVPAVRGFLSAAAGYF